MVIFDLPTWCDLEIFVHSLDPSFLLRAWFTALPSSQFFNLPVNLQI